MTEVVVRRRRRVQPESLLEGMNPEQREVVQHGEGPLQVLAGAGSGKTRALVHRIAYLIGSGVEPSSILAVTFSKKAADEMNARLTKLGVTECRVGTWHSVALEILREERPEFRRWEIDDKDRFRGIVKKVLGYQGMDWTTADLTNVVNFVGLCKAECALPGSEESLELAKARFDENPCGQNNPQLLWEAYDRAGAEAEQRQLLTFDDMLLWTWRLFTEDEQARRRWAARWNYLLVDECQDNNRVQNELTKLLGRDHRNVMSVGDVAQAIYKFRGARPEVFAGFVQEWAPCKVIRMFRNYRSGPEVIAAGNAVARRMPEGMWMGVDMSAERGGSATIETRVYSDLDDEGRSIVRRLQTAHEDGTSWKSMAVLYRTNAQSRGIEEACLSNRVPYVVIGGTNFYDRKEVKDLLAYLRVAEGRGGFEDVRRCINAPFRFLGKAFVDKVGASHRSGAWTDTVRTVSFQGGIQSRQRVSVEQWAGLVDSIAKSIEIRASMGDVVPVGDQDRILSSPTDDARPHMPAALLERVISETDFVRWLTRDEGAETVENNRVSNVRELVRSAERFTTVTELLDYVDETLEAARKAKRGDDADRVTLCSLHRSKGLEWPVVAISGCNEKILPHARAEDIEEERRLFYVGVTRAMDLLHVSCVRTAVCGEMVRNLEPSRFLSEAFGAVVVEAEVA